ncbi:hypothetical protein C7974DRAFT_410156 [Boeremia exigua]|uniref:uncharacterized protein n=1 Tax=Boeremia exigua TaxID=749465 RepID=UPI001E8D8E10|nr:uncharacterized protein C7974DRAFT_410156 [Boeremia exigua]KAH6639172.1 hypothetical protein C7974DRAFT_410156 [Boeremia exigua]
MQSPRPRLYDIIVVLTCALCVSGAISLLSLLYLIPPTPSSAKIPGTNTTITNLKRLNIRPARQLWTAEMLGEQPDVWDRIWATVGLDLEK